MANLVIHAVTRHIFHVFAVQFYESHFCWIVLPVMVCFLSLLATKPNP